MVYGRLFVQVTTFLNQDVCTSLHRLNGQIVELVVMHSVNNTTTQKKVQAPDVSLHLEMEDKTVNAIQLHVTKQVPKLLSSSTIRSHTSVRKT